MLKKISFTLIVLFCCCEIAVSQFSLNWENRYINPYGLGTEYPYIDIDVYGRIAFAVTMNRTGGDQGIMIRQLNRAGQENWQYEFSDTWYDEFVTDIKTDPGANVIVAGGFNSYLAFDDYLVLKFSPDGQRLWKCQFGSSQNTPEYVTAIDIDASGNIYGTGPFSSGGIATFKITPAGALEWIQYAPYQSGYSYPYNIKVTSDGYSYVIGENNNEWVALKYSPAGVLLAQDRYDGGLETPDAVAYDLDFDIYGNVYVTGRSDGNFIVMKYYPSLIPDWITSIPSGCGLNIKIGYTSNLYNCSEDANDGNNMLTNTPELYVSGVNQNSMTKVCKLNPCGQLLWSHDYVAGLSTETEKECIILDPYYNVYIGAYSRVDYGNYNMLLISYDKDGNYIGTASYDHLNSIDQVSSMKGANERDGFKIYMAGYSCPDNATLKYGLSTDIQNPSNRNATGNDAMNYPNPFNPKTTISFNLQKTGNVRIIVYNILGEAVFENNYNSLTSGKHSVEFDGSKLSSGIYYYRIITNEYNVVKSMVLLK